jgi:ubiquinone biosynthesis UbiH/UbiF/VisC/COQ6 family hydroxylase
VNTPDSLARNVDGPADAVIVGAGPAGLALAVALGQVGLSTVVVDRQARSALENPAPDGRDVALTHRSRRVLETLGILPRVEACEIAPIRSARVLNGTSPYFLGFESGDATDGPLGHLVANCVLRKASWDAALEDPHVRVLTEVRIASVTANSHLATVTLQDGTRVEAPLLVAADGRFSETRRALGIGASMLDFGRSAIVCRMSHLGSHGQVAREWFDYDGTLAVLPLSDNLSSIVLTLPTGEAKVRMDATAAQFAAAVTAKLRGDLGPMRLAGERRIYPLVATYAKRFVTSRCALLGDAAVGMHPVTAHGYNFGLYGVETLARIILEALEAKRDIGSLDTLKAYEREHRRATYPIFAGTNALVRLYTDTRPLARVARGGLLRLANRLSPLKRWVAHQLTAT